ncbi:MAG: helix-turn-helix domain-containing protein [Bacteroidales bacterium]|nr:helix-turn-helix domain-containing protein [Bacteroidales bacterium]
MNFPGVKSSLVGILLLMGTLLHGQDSFSGRNLLGVLSMDDGLPCPYVDDLCRDSAGFLWVATSGGGLCRYDGYQFITFSSTSAQPLRSNFIRNICEDRFHRLWIGSEGGLDLLDLKTIRRLALPHPDLEGPGGQLCSYLTLDACGDLWFKTGKTLYKILFDAEGGVSRILSYSHEGLSPTNLVFQDVDRDGSVWVGLLGRLYKVDETRPGVLDIESAVPGFAYGERTYLSGFLPAGQDLWISTEDGLYYLNRPSGRWKHYVHDDRDAGSLTQNFITGLDRTADGQVIATSLHGFNLYNPVTDRFERVGEDVVNCVRVYGSLLALGTETRGILIYRPKQLAVRNWRNDPLDRGSIAAGAVNAVCEDASGTLWAGTVEGGLSIREAGSETFTHVTRDNGLSHNSVSALCPVPRDAMAVGTWGGGIDFVGLSRPHRVLRHLQDPSLDYIGSLDYDERNGLLWIGSNRGVFRCDLQTGRIEPALEKQASGCIGSCLDSSGHLWVGCREGLYVFDLNAQDGRFPCTHYPYKLDAPATKAAEMICYIIEASDGTFWLGSNGNGVYHGVRTEDGSLSFTAYTTRQGLSNDRIRSLAEDTSGRIWISTEHGLNVLDPSDGSVTAYYREDGLESTQFHWNNACKGADGLLYFGQAQGLSVIDPRKTGLRVPDSPVLLTKVSVGDEEYRDPFLKEVTFHERDRSILFEFTQPDPGAGRPAAYEYRLEGFDAGWTPVAPGRHEAAYSSLPSGNYRFLVRTKSSGPMELSVHVRPYFYKTWWFLLLCVALAILAVYAVSTWRTRSLVRNQELLQRTVEERTREISQQKKLVEQKAEELDRQNRILRRQNEELAGHRLLSAQEPQQEDPFATKVIDTLRALYKKPDLDVAAFCAAMGMSKTLLNKRIQETFGQPTAQFIRTYRLSVAREMLLNNRENKMLNISEIAYEVGFNDPKYFSRCFAKEFGVSQSSFPEN